MICPLRICASLKDSQSPKSRKTWNLCEYQSLPRERRRLQNTKIISWCFFQITNNIFNAYWHMCVHTHTEVLQNSIKTNKENKQTKPRKTTKQNVKNPQNKRNPQNQPNKKKQPT